MDKINLSDKLAFYSDDIKAMMAAVGSTSTAR
jgi:hypothetical protein